MPKNNGPLQIRLTEPVIFLKGPSTGLDFRGRPQAVRQDGPTAMVRGLLTLRLSKPTRIRTISIKLEGKARTEWPEGIGSKRMDTSEEHVILLEQTTFFNAIHNDESRPKLGRRALSVGPGIRHDDDDLYFDHDHQLQETPSGTPNEEDDLDDWLEISRPGRRGLGGGSMIRSNSAMPGTHDNHSWHRDGFSRRPSFDQTPISTPPSLLDLSGLNIENRGPSPAYTPHASPPRRPVALPDHTSSIPSALRQSNSALPTLAREQSNDGTESRGRPSLHIHRPGSNQEVSTSRTQHRGSILEGEENITTGSALRPILVSRNSQTGNSGEVRFANPAQEADADKQATSSRRSSAALESDSTTTPEGVSVPPPSASLPTTGGGRAASVRTLGSQHSASSASLPLSPNENTEAEAHPSGIQAVSVVNTAHNTPVNSAPPSIRHHSSTETLGNTVPHSSGTESSPNPSRPTSTISNSNRQTSETSINNLPRNESSASVTRQGRSSRTGSASTIVETAGAISSGSHVNLPSALRNAARSQQRSTSNTPSIASSHQQQHLRTSTSTHRDSLDDSRGRKSSKFSLAATLRGLSRGIEETFHHHGRSSSKSRSRRSSPVRGAGESTSSGFSGERPSLSTNTTYSNSSINMSRQNSSNALATNNVDTMRRPASRNPSYRQDEFGVTSSDRGASTTRRSRSRDRSTSTARGNARGEDERSRSRARGRHIGMKVLTDKLGLGEHEDGHHHHVKDEDIHNWKEFRKGTYNYPISFPIPVNAPPTIHAEFGSVVYRLKATVVKVGALTPNLTEDMEITMIAQPQEDDMEETENVIVERQWEEQMRYQITLGGKAFPIAGTIPISIRLMPLLKCKIHRLTVALEEKTDYFAQERKVARHETPKRFILLFIKQPDYKERIEPLLPIISDDPNAAENSPIAEMARQAVINNPPTDVFDLERDPNDSMYAQLMEPQGPWHLEKELHLPDCSSKIKFTTKHEQTNITVSHWLKVTIRVERGDDVALDTKGRRKQFDIIIETPIKILDCRVNPQWNSLPTYSVTNRGIMTTSGVCAIHGNKGSTTEKQTKPENNLISTSSSIVHAHVTNEAGPSSSHMHRRGTTDNPNGMSSTNHHHNSNIAGPSGSGSHTPTGENPNGDDTLLERNIVYDRLMSGQQTETGETPPSYGEAIAVAAAENSARQSRSRSRVNINPNNNLNDTYHGGARSGLNSRSVSRVRLNDDIPTERERGRGHDQDDANSDQIVFSTRTRSNNNSRSRSRLGIRD